MSQYQNDIHCMQIMGRYFSMFFGIDVALCELLSLLLGTELQKDGKLERVQRRATKQLEA